MIAPRALCSGEFVLDHIGQLLNLVVVDVPLNVGCERLDGIAEHPAHSRRQRSFDGGEATLHVLYLGPRIEEREGVLRVARYSARAPVAEGRLRYDAERAEVELVADRLDGPYAGVHRMTALEFLARWVDHVPERDEVRVRYAGAYATRRRVWWRRRGGRMAASSGHQ